jgi:hypothetical protein
MAGQFAGHRTVPQLLDDLPPLRVIQASKANSAAEALLMSDRYSRAANGCEQQACT